MIDIIHVKAKNWDKGRTSKRHRRYPGEIDTIMFHRIMLNGTPVERTNAEALIKFFEDEGKKWIGTADMPYTFIIHVSGSISQCVQLSTVTPHACRYSRRSIGIGVIGDFRVGSPTKQQSKTCVELAKELALILLAPPLVTVHGAIPRATKDSNKLLGGKDECPGEYFHETWHAARRAVATVMKQERIEW
jgi:hypothetical protein